LVENDEIDVPISPSYLSMTLDLIETRPVAGPRGGRARRCDTAVIMVCATARAPGLWLNFAELRRSAGD
jgi:hypothetical protein